ncbi:BrnT family toxin [Rhodoplanes azumiensis]|uniref:BrnT family toxin n=1 Tax=Rhodoplanes azumiensis TaxID=1897628 RepID=A0ABW5AL05_9BRAD
MIPDGFEWDDIKRDTVLRERGIDFVDAAKVLLGTVYQYRSPWHDEPRFVAIGPLTEGILIAIVYTIRDENIRIITARRARRNEQAAYRNALSAQRDEGED